MTRDDMRMRPSSLPAGTWFLLTVLPLIGCATHRPGDSRASYADPAACASCHAQIAKAYHQTGMGRSFYRPSAAAIPSGARYFHKTSNRYYEFFPADGQFYLRRHQVGFGGKTANRIEQRIDYVVGSGNHARTYLHRNGEGQLIELPVSWYSEAGGYCAMSPGYDNAHQEDFRRPVPEDCLFCHNGYPADSTLVEGIDCQRCHGPGLRHVQLAASRKANPGEIRAAIVNPKRLDRDRQLDDCMQCHLETTSLRLPNAIRTYA